MKFLITAITGCFLFLNASAQTVPEQFKAVDSALTATRKLMWPPDTATIRQLNKEQSMAYTAYEKLYGHINGLRTALAKRKDDDLKYTSQLFYTKGEAAKLYTRMKDYQQKVLAALPDSAAKEKAKDYLQLDVSSFTKKSWPEYYFRNLPAVAAATILNKIQNDAVQCMMLVTGYKKP